MESKLKRMRFSKETIKKSVSEVESGVSRRDVCKKYGVSYVTLGSWVSRYGSPEYLATCRKSFSNKQKREVIQAIKLDKLSFREASLRYGINIRTLQAWKYQFIEEGIVTRPKIEETSLSVDAEKLALQKALEAAQLKVLALETLIDVAEESLKIKIRKKPGAKQ